MSGHNIKIPGALYERLKILAVEKGYSSAEEFVNHILEKAADAGACEMELERIKRQLKGLGYFNG